MKEQNQEWVEKLYLRYKTDVYRLCLVILQDSYGAEDVTQETFCKAQRSGRPAPGKEKAWLLKIARNGAYDWLRKRKREVSLEPGVLAQAMEHKNPLPMESQLEYLELIRGLPPLERDIVTLHIVDGLTHKEIAGLLHMTVHSEKKRYERAIAALRQDYKEEP